MALDDRSHDLPLERDCIRIAEAAEHILKAIVAARVERQRASERVLDRVRWIKMCAGHEAVGNRLRGRMCAAMAQELWQHMGVRSVRALAVRRRDRLEHLDTAQAADEHAVRARRNDDAHRGVARLEHRTSDMRAQPRRNIRIGDANAGIDLERIEAEIEQNTVAILRA